MEEKKLDMKLKEKELDEEELDEVNGGVIMNGQNTNPAFGAMGNNAFGAMGGIASGIDMLD